MKEETFTKEIDDFTLPLPMTAIESFMKKTVRHQEMTKVMVQMDYQI